MRTQIMQMKSYHERTLLCSVFTLHDTYSVLNTFSDSYMARFQV